MAVRFIKEFFKRKDNVKNTKQMDVGGFHGAKQFPGVEHLNRKDELLYFFANDLTSHITFSWPDGSLWSCSAVYFHDTKQPNGQVPGAEVYDVIKAVVHKLREQSEETSARMLMFRDGHLPNIHCVGGTWEMRGVGRPVQLFVRQTENTGARYLLAKIY